MPASKILIHVALAIAPIAFAQDLVDSHLMPETTGEACSEEPRWDAFHIDAQPTGISLLRPVPHGPKRLFGVIPNYRADQAQKIYTPLTRSDKYKIARQDSFDWPNYLLLAGYAVQSQVASGGFSHNGGMTGFAEFYARAAADQVIGSYITEAILPSLFHEDPRYFRLGSGTFRHRAFYAASRVVITRGDNGHARLYLSELVGNAAVIGITTSYYPASRSAGEAGERYGQQLGNDVISNLLTEFWPDVKRRLPFLHK